MRNSTTRNAFIHQANETQGSYRNNTNFAPSQFQGPVTTPSWMKDIQQAEFQAVRTLALNEPLYIVETQYTMNFEQFQLQN